MSGYYSTNGGQHVFRLLAGEKTTGYSGPYVVIDPEDREAVERLRLAFDHADGRGMGPTEDMQAALREFATPTPPKPDEPQGLGAVVEDEHGVLWVRAGDSHDGQLTDNWRQTSGWFVGNWQPWDRIAAVRILSPGVES